MSKILVSKLYPPPLKVYGPYTRSDYRKHVIVYDGELRITISYPKFLMQEHLNRLLSANETVDHINSNFEDNTILNLQILSLEDNIRKSSIKTAIRVKLNCNFCGKEFMRRQSSINSYKRNHDKTGNMYCSKKCNGLENH